MNFKYFMLKRKYSKIFWKTMYYLSQNFVDNINNVEDAKVLC